MIRSEGPGGITGRSTQWRRTAPGQGRASTTGHYVGEPIFDQGGSNVLLVSVTNCRPRRRGALIGVAGVDLKCEALNAFIGSIVENLEAERRRPRAEARTAGSSRSS